MKRIFVASAAAVFAMAALAGPSLAAQFPADRVGTNIGTGCVAIVLSPDEIKRVENGTPQPADAASRNIGRLFGQACGQVLQAPPPPPPGL